MLINKKKKWGKLRVAIYVRVSTDEQAIKGASIEAQQEEIKKFIDYKDSEYTFNAEKHTYIDAWFSGTLESRPALNKMLDWARNWEFDVLMVWKIDRLYRRNFKLLEVVDLLEKLGISFKSITQDFDTSSMGKMMLWMLGCIAELERDTIRERTILGKKRKAENGYYVWWWTSKLGFDIIKEVWGCKLFINEEEAKLVQRIFTLFVKEWKTWGEIANLFTLEGILTKYDTNFRKKILKDKENEKEWVSTNKKWVHDNHRKNRKEWYWHPATVSEILKNTIYKWVYYYGLHETTKNDKTGKTTTKTRDINDPLVVSYTCPAIIDEELFNEAQILLASNQTRRSNADTYIFTGLIRCGICGKTYCGYKSSKGTVNYRCNGSVGNKLPKEDRCHNSQVSEKILLDTTWNKLRTFFNDPDSMIQGYYSRKKEEGIIGQINEVKSSIADICVKINDHEKKMEKIFIDKYNTDDIAIIQVKETIITNISVTIKGLQNRKVELENKLIKLKRIERSRDVVSEMSKKFQQNMGGIANHKKKIELMQKYIGSIHINKRKVCISLKFWFDLNATVPKSESGKKSEKTSNNDDDPGGETPFLNAKIDYLKNRKCLLKPIDWEVKIWSGLVSIAILIHKNPRAKRGFFISLWKMFKKIGENIWLSHFLKNPLKKWVLRDYKEVFNYIYGTPSMHYREITYPV